MVEIYDMLVEKGAIKFGDFTLTSGKRSSYYVDVKEAITDPSVLSAITEKFASVVDHKAGYIAGMELGAVPLVVALSLKTGMPYIIVRKEKREHGTGGRFVGKVPKEKVVVIEDVITTGKSAGEVVKLLRENGAVVDEVVAVVDRNEGGSEMLNGMGITTISLVKMGY